MAKADRKTITPQKTETDDGYPPMEAPGCSLYFAQGAVGLSKDLTVFDGGMGAAEQQAKELKTRRRDPAGFDGVSCLTACCGLPSGQFRPRDRLRNGPSRRRP